MDPSTPLTTGLVVIVFGVTGAAICVVLWVQRQMDNLRRHLDAELNRQDERIGKQDERITLTIVAQSEHRTWVAQHYVSKQDAAR